MNLAFLSFYNGLSDRGAETFVHELATRLAEQVSVTVYQNGRSSAHTKYAVKYLASQLSLPEFSPPPDILIPSNGRFQSILSRLWSLRDPAKILIPGQSGPGLDDRINLYTFPHAFVGLTDYQVSWAKKVNSSVKIVKIPNGVSLDNFRPDANRLSIDLPHPIILYVAALEQIKRHNLLIDAVASTSASLLLVGQGSLEDQVRQQAQERLGPDRFRIISQPHSSMPSVYAVCDLFAYPTAPWESFGIAMLEAMASGLPVVATADPIRAEIIGDAGLLADPLDSAKFSAAINQALSTHWGDKPRNQAAKFSWDNIAQQYLNLCKSL